MKKILFITVILILTVFIFADNGTKLLRQPDICKNRVVFMYGGNLWIAPIEGGKAIQLTSHPGMEYSPKFSPDGKYVAFSGQYDGNTDVYIVPSGGGSPVRLTFHPGSDIVLGWSPDGEKIIFRTGRISYSRFNRIFEISKKGGPPKPLPMPMAELATYSPDGKSMAYTPIINAFNTWKQYRGGRTTPIWIINLTTYEKKEIPHENASDTFPVWIGDTIYFMSDRNGIMNLFSFRIGSENVTQLTYFEDYDIKSVSGSAEKIVFDRAGNLYVYNPSTNTSEQMDIEVPSELIHTRPKYENVSREIRNASISPTGKRAVFEARGEILTVPAEKGDIRNLSNTTGACERYPAWSPDGKYIAYFSDKSGEYALYLIDQKGLSEPEIIEFKDPSFYYFIQWSPDSKKLAFTDKHLNLYYLNINDKKPVLIDSDNYSNPDRSLDPVWSKDSKWIAYAKRMDNYMRAIHLYSLEDKKTFQVTDGMSDASYPRFDKKGKYLFFTASTKTGLSSGWLDLSSYERRVMKNLYLVVLDKDLPTPFLPESDEEKIEKKEKTDNETDEEEKDITIDLENINQRIVDIPVPEREYSNIQISEDEKIFYMAIKPGSRRSYNLYCFDIKERKEKEFLSGISFYDLSFDGKKLLYRSGSNWGIVKTSGSPNVGEGKLNLSEMEIKIDPKAEWKQMYLESWRINRDFFYDPGMHGRDWNKMYKKYSVFIPYVAHRSDLVFLIGELIGELQVGHAYVGGGDYPDIESVPVGLLGADYTIENGLYRIKKIYSGLNWNPDLRAPLTEPGVNVNEGDYILDVNGVELTASMNIYSLFENTAGKQITLLVNDRPEKEGSRRVTVVPIRSERGLRNMNWVEGNRKKVEDLSSGHAGYIYLPNTSVAGYEYFNRYFFANLDKEALVVDERFNGGGYAADYIVEILDRKFLNYWATRDGKDFKTPWGSVKGPKVMIINEYAGSGGDALPYYFRKMNIGPLVGKRTWGGLIGVYDYPRLMDGGYVTAPRVAIWDPKDGWIVENKGVPPDYEVEMNPKDIIEGKDPQLEKAVEVVMEQLKKNPVPEHKRPPFPER